MFNIREICGPKVSGMIAGLGLAGVSFALMLSVSTADAATYKFDKLTNNNVENVGSQLSVDVVDDGGLASFTFKNAVGIASSITDIYFDGGTTPILATPITFATSGAGVAFSDPATPGNLPGANNASPAFVTSTGLSADSDAGPGGVSGKGVNAASEWLTIFLTYVGGNTITDVIAALNSGDLRIGLHVQAIGALGGSDGYINEPKDGGAGGGAPPPVPLPAGLPLMLTGLGIVAVLRRKSRKAA